MIGSMFFKYSVQLIDITADNNISENWHIDNDHCETKIGASAFPNELYTMRFKWNTVKIVKPILVSSLILDSSGISSWKDVTKSW